MKRFHHPELGLLDLEYTPFEIAEQPSLRLYLLAPALAVFAALSTFAVIPPGDEVTV